MKVITLFIFLQVFRFLYSWINVEMNGFSFSYVLSSSGRCEIGDNRFGFYTGFSINECVRECGLRPHCKTLNYLHNMGVCELFTSGGNFTYFKDGACSQVEKSDIIHQTTPCGQCESGQVCDMLTKRCRASECIQLTQPLNGRIFGNLRGIGDVIRYQCNKGYIERNGEKVAAKCLENGTWNATVECIRKISITVCEEPFITNAIISKGEIIEESVRTVTCNNKTTVDVNSMTSDIQCMADGAWIPNVTCSKFNSVIFKVVTGNGKSVMSAWKSGRGSTNNKLCREISTTNCSDHYRDPRIDKWGTLDVKKVRYSVYKDNAEVAWVEFNGTGSSNMNWFHKRRILGSSYTDLDSNSNSNYFGIEPNVLLRFFYISAGFNGCEGDKLWLVTIDGIHENNSCWYDRKLAPTVFYSTLNEMGTTKQGGSDLDQADTVIVSINT